MRVKLQHLFSQSFASLEGYTVGSKAYTFILVTTAGDMIQKQLQQSRLWAVYVPDQHF